MPFDNQQAVMLRALFDERLLFYAHPAYHVGIGEVTKHLCKFVTIDISFKSRTIAITLTEPHTFFAAQNIVSALKGQGVFYSDFEFAAAMMQETGTVASIWYTPDLSQDGFGSAQIEGFVATRGDNAMFFPLYSNQDTRSLIARFSEVSVVRLTAV
jgi:hypothetical protein